MLALSGWCRSRSIRTRSHHGDFDQPDKPGFASSATKAGYTIGKALENWFGQDKIDACKSGLLHGPLTAEGYIDTKPLRPSLSLLAWPQKSAEAEDLVIIDRLVAGLITLKAV